MLGSGLLAGLATLPGCEDNGSRDDDTGNRTREAMHDVTRFGARPGHSDSTAAFRAALRRAAGRASADRPQTVHVPGADQPYHVAALSLPSFVRLVGDGARSELRPPTSLTRWIRTGAASRGTGVTGLRLDSAGLARQVVTTTRGSRDCTLHSVELGSSRLPLPEKLLDVRPGSVGIALTESRLDGCRHGVVIGGDARRITVADCVVDGWIQRAIWVRGTATSAPSDLRFESCVLEPQARGGTVRQPISFTGGGRLIERVRILGNVVHGSGTDYHDARNPGTADLISLHHCSGFLIADNVARDGGEVGITVSQQCENGRVVRNRAERNGAAGIAIGSGTSEYVRNIAVLDNRCLDNGRPGRDDRTTERGRTGIYLWNAQDIRVRGNVCTNRSTDHQRFGLTVVASNATIEDNDLAGNAVATTTARGVEAGRRGGSTAGPASIAGTG